MTANGDAAPLQQMLTAIEEHAHGPLLLAVGFDGVLLDYQRQPEAVQLPAAQRHALRELAARRDTSLAVISGRPIVDLRPRTELGDRVFYVGLHGLETSGPGFAAREREAIDAIRGRVHVLAETIAPSLSSAAGVVVENKGAALAVHTRGAGAGDAVWARIHLLSTAAGLVKRDELRVVRGNHVIELMPNVGAPRAAALRQIRQHLERRDGQPVFTIYIGEDVPDDDAFEAIEGEGISAIVGSRGQRARYHLRSPADVWEIIGRVTALRPRAA